MANEYLFHQADIIVETDYKRLTKGFCENFREGLKELYPNEVEEIEKHFNDDIIRFDLEKIDEIEYNLKNKIKSIKGSTAGSRWTSNPNGKKDFRRIFIYKEVD